MENDICRLVNHPERLDRSTLYMLRTIVARYPFFQTARLLMLNNLYLLQDPDFGRELRSSILYIADRRALCRLLNGLEQSRNISVVDELPENDLEPTVDRTLALIDAFLGAQPEMPQHLVVETPVSTDYLSMVMREEEGSVPMENVSPAIPAPPMHGLKSLKSETPIVHEDNAEVNESELAPEFFTETLARVYIKQKKYDRALEIIRSLYLNYPEKSIYFADQIRFLEKLIENNNLKKEI